MSLPFQTAGYENMELSTQLIIKEALVRRVKVDVLDRKAQFIRLSKNGKIEYIREATKTSKDSYVASEIMGNKLVSKIILEEVGIKVPKGKSYDDFKTLIKDFRPWAGKKIVIKPKTTNYGIGISILEKNFKNKEFEDAGKNAFKFDQTVLVEEFIEGIECRFLVIAGKTVALLHRIPANVRGDGKKNIAQLVAIKNKDPRRGKGHITPLEIIEIGQVERAVLKEQNLTPQTVAPKGQIIFLRKNSNISTGGDSIDYTDKVHAGYKLIAEKAVATVGAKICGVDIILNNFQAEPTATNYALIEVNYNPVLYFHDFPFEGKNRHSAKYVLDLLGF